MYGVDVDVTVKGAELNVKHTPPKINLTEVYNTIEAEDGSWFVFSLCCYFAQCKTIKPIAGIHSTHNYNVLSVHVKRVTEHAFNAETWKISTTHAPTASPRDTIAKLRSRMMGQNAKAICCE